MKGQTYLERLSKRIINYGGSIAVVRSNKQIGHTKLMGFDGSAQPENKFIYLFIPNHATSLNPAVACLAHEYGHLRLHTSGKKAELSVADKILFHELTSKHSNTGSKISKAGRRAIYKEEKDAWRLARRTLKDIGYKDWLTFEMIRDGALSSYRDVFWNLK